MCTPVSPLQRLNRSTKDWYTQLPDDADTRACERRPCANVMWSNVVVLLMVLGLGYTTGALANPQDYPQFAQQKIKDNIPIQFIQAEVVKKHLDDDTTQMLVDVRRRSSYDKAHLPGAVSIPLRELPQRAVEIPRDIPVVLY
jgi:hypothetical protein